VATRTLSPNDVAEAIPSGLHHRFTVDEYHQMIETGIVKNDDRVQLVGGVVVEMSPQSEKHARLIQRLNRMLVRALSDDFLVRPQLPLTLGNDSEPEPDLAVVKAVDALSVEEHPRRAVLVVEVSGESLRLDRAVKAAIYATADIPEYWIVDAENRRVELYGDPEQTNAHYRSTAVLAIGDVLQSRAIPQLVVSLEDLFR